MCWFDSAGLAIEGLRSLRVKNLFASLLLFSDPRQSRPEPVTNLFNQVWILSRFIMDLSDFGLSKIERLSGFILEIRK